MFNIFFGEFQIGRLARLPYLGYYLALTLLIVLAGIGIGASVGIAERIGGGNMADTEAVIAEKFGLVGFLLIVAVLAVWLLVELNITATRIRDMGLPGWWVFLGGLIISALVSQFAGPQAVGIVNLLMFLALVLILSDAFRRVNA